MTIILQHRVEILQGDVHRSQTLDI